MGGVLHRQPEPPVPVRGRRALARASISRSASPSCSYCAPPRSLFHASMLLDAFIGGLGVGALALTFAYEKLLATTGGELLAVLTEPGLPRRQPGDAGHRLRRAGHGGPARRARALADHGRPASVRDGGHGVRPDRHRRYLRRRRTVGQPVGTGRGVFATAAMSRRTHDDGSRALTW